MNTSLFTAVALISQVPRSVPKSGGLGGSRPAGASGSDLGAASNGIVRMSSGVADSLFSVNSTDVTKQKIRLMERVGTAFGVKMNDYKDMRSYGQAIREAMAGMDPATLKVMEASLGLPKLGVRIIDVVEAMEEPGGSTDDKLEAALRKDADEAGNRDRKHPLGFTIDEIGRYGPDGHRHQNR